MPVLIRELARPLHDLSHARAHEIEIRQLSGLEHGFDLLEAPLADALLGVWRDVRCLLPVGALGIAGVSETGLHCAKKIPGRVAFPAMRDGVRKIAAAV